MFLDGQGWIVVLYGDGNINHYYYAEVYPEVGSLGWDVSTVIWDCSLVLILFLSLSGRESFLYGDEWFNSDILELV